MDAGAALFPTISATTSHGIVGLDASSYTAHKLKHSSAEHLHDTTRRFFIGPIPEGWLSSNRKSWYKRRLELGSYSSRAASFKAAAIPAHHRRTVTGLDRSARARLSLSFPQPEDVGDSASEREAGRTGAEQSDTEAEVEDEDEDGDGDEWFEANEIEPVSTIDQDVLEQAKAQDAATNNEERSRPPAHALDSQTSQNQSLSPNTSPKTRRKDRTEFVSSRDASPTDLNRSSASDNRDFSSQNGNLGALRDSADASSRTALLPRADSAEKPPVSRDGAKSLHKHEPMPVSQQSNEPQLSRQRASGVRFKVSEAVADRQLRVGRRADSAKKRVGRRIMKRDTLREGAVVKMERMLVRVDVTQQQVPAEYDENDSMRTETKVVEKWKEFMVVARKSKKGEDEDFRLQFYKTRVIPEIDDSSKSKKPAREIKLIPRSTHINLFSSLDKSVVIWHPYRKGTRITIMKCESAANSVEWYTFLRDALGMKRPEKLQVFVPDLGVALQIEKPFEDLEKAGQDEEDEDAAIAKTVEAEQAVAGKIVDQCLGMLKGNPEWTNVLEQWQASFKPGLAWKRYDRLEWVHGANEQKMYGSMAMQHTYELELRPKLHYPQHTFGKKGKAHEEPAPIEGFLIRMTSQKGVHKRMGKTFFKRLYFSTHDHLLVFNRPAQATPPHPPKLQTLNGSNIPSSKDILEQTPVMFDIDPYQLDPETKQVKWLQSGMQDRISHKDRQAYEEARRNHANLSASDGYINMTRIQRVQKMHWGTDSVDETLDSGTDVDFHASVPDTHDHDGTTAQIDDERMFELILENGLVVRLQAYDRRARDEWLSRLRKLVKYWKLRKTADMNNFKSIRASNLNTLKIDEDVEAELGQFGHKWEMTRSEASPELYNVCSISNCRTISLSGHLYRKVRRHATFQHCGVVLAGGKLLIYQSTLRKSSGERVPNIHQEKQQVIDLKGCYVYSGLVVDDDLLYQNRTFDANHMGTMASLPRVWTEDGWTSTDVDVMCCFVVWMNTRKGWFRTAGDTLFDGGKDKDPAPSDTEAGPGKKRAKLKRVRQLGIPGRGMVFKCRSRAERDLWVLNLAIEIERLVEEQKWEEARSGEGDVRFEG